MLQTGRKWYLTRLNGISVWFFPFPCGIFQIRVVRWHFRVVKWLFRMEFMPSVQDEQKSSDPLADPEASSG